MRALDQYGRRVDETIHLDPTYWRMAPEAYRSVYVKKPGFTGYPAGGLHFSKELLTRIADKGVELAYVTLHVGGPPRSSQFVILVRKRSRITRLDPNSSRLEPSPPHKSIEPWPRSDGASLLARGSCELSSHERSTTNPRSLFGPKRHGQISIFIRDSSSRSWMYC